MLKTWLEDHWTVFLAVVASLSAVLLAWIIGQQVFEAIPHLEDEIAYVWQARLMASGEVVMDSPIEPKRFLVPFVIDYEGQRFGKYPIGWPALLALGERFELRDWVNPILAGLAVWLTFVLGRRLMGPVAGLLATLLTLTSAFFWLNAGSLLSHPLGLVLSLAFVLFFWEALSPGPQRAYHWLPAVTAGLVLGLFALARPFTALGVGVPFGLLGLFHLLRGPARQRWHILTIGLVALPIAGLHLIWQAAATGDPFLNPYTLWWPYDKIGFGPGYGVVPSGHSLKIALMNLRHSMSAGVNDLFGWFSVSWLFLPFGFWALRRNGPALMTSSVFFVLMLWYMLYWIGAWLFGPRYQFEGLYSLTFLTAAGICWLAGWPLQPGADPPAPREAVTATSRRWPKPRAVLMLLLLGLLVGANLVYYVPLRLQTMQGLYGIERATIAPFQNPAGFELTPAVVIVSAKVWQDYGTFIEVEDPYLTSPYIFTFGNKPGLRALLTFEFPERTIYYYYPDQPSKLYLLPRD